MGAESALKYCLVAQGSLCAWLKLHFWRCSEVQQRRTHAVENRI